MSMPRSLGLGLGGLGGLGGLSGLGMEGGKMKARTISS